MFILKKKAELYVKEVRIYEFLGDSSEVYFVMSLTHIIFVTCRLFLVLYFRYTPQHNQSFPV